MILKKSILYSLGTLEGMYCYAGDLLAPAEGFGLRPRFFFFPLGQQNNVHAGLPILGHV